MSVKFIYETDNEIETPNGSFGAARMKDGEGNLLRTSLDMHCKNVSGTAMLVIHEGANLNTLTVCDRDFKAACVDLDEGQLLSLWRSLGPILHKRGLIDEAEIVI